MQASQNAAGTDWQGGRHDNKPVTFRGTLTAVFGDSLTVGGRAVKTDSLTKVTRGLTPIMVSDLVVGDSLVVAGFMRSDASVLARAIVVVIPRPQFVQLADTVTAVSVPDSTFGVGDTTVHVNSHTRFSENSSFADLKVGDRVHVLAVRQADGSLLALVVNVGDRDDDDHDGHGDNGDHDGGEHRGHHGDDDGGHGKDKGHGRH
jgi:hypothetical protein